MTEKYIEEIYFQLSRDLPYASKGGELTTKELILKAPSSKHQRATTQLRKSFNIAGLEMAKLLKDMTPENEDREDFSKKAEEEEREVTPNSILQLLYSSHAVDVGDCHQLLREMLLSGCCYLDLETKMTSPIYDRLLERDLEQLFGRFFITFLYTKPE